jgi:hypothetical protein
MIQPRFFLLAGMILIPAAIKVTPYVLDRFGIVNITQFDSIPWNISPLGALCLFVGAKLNDRRWSYAIPLIAMAISDAVIGLVMGDIRMGFHVLIPAVYGAFAVSVWLGTWLRDQRGPVWKRILSVVGAGFLAELSFFLITNFANWATQGTFFPQRFPHTFAGLLECYWVAIPFFGRSMASMVIYSTVLFAGYEWMFGSAFGARAVAAEEPVTTGVHEHATA